MCPEVELRLYIFFLLHIVLHGLADKVNSIEVHVQFGYHINVESDSFQSHKVVHD